MSAPQLPHWAVIKALTRALGLPLIMAVPTGQVVAGLQGATTKVMAR